MDKERSWTVLLIGGASGTGKSTIAYEIGKHYGVNVMEIDDIHLAVRAVTTEKEFPAIHYWKTGVDWMQIGIDGNVNWLSSVGRELIPVVKALVERHLEDQLPVVIEGDFISPELASMFNNPKVKILFINEDEKSQIIQNYLSREGGTAQDYRSEISIAYNQMLTEECNRNQISMISSRPWETVLFRAQEFLEKD